MVLAVGMPEHIPNTQGREIAGTAECKYRSALVVDESRLEFWLPHLSRLYDDEAQLTIDETFHKRLSAQNELSRDNFRKMSQ